MKTSIARLAILLLVSTLFTMVGTSCNTVEGVGEDVQHAGHHIERAARH